jgi:hypothetical protein
VTYARTSRAATRRNEHIGWGHCSERQTLATFGYLFPLVTLRTLGPSFGDTWDARESCGCTSWVFERRLAQQMPLSWDPRVVPPTGLFNDMYRPFALSKPSTSEASKGFRLLPICPWPSLLVSARSMSMQRAVVCRSSNQSQDVGAGED